MLKKTHLSMAVSAALGMSATAMMPLANAQDGATLEEVVVTGSRIRKTNLVSPSPVVQVDASELLYQGTVRVEDMLATLPQVYSGYNSTGLANGATGTATINLRNLGDERTLTLLNGRRMPVGSPIDGGTGADMNQIPGALIRTIEVMTGGGSAVYGSDAVAGVVNFLMMDDFEGVKFDYQYSGFNHKNDNGGMQALLAEKNFDVPNGSETDGETTDISLIIGGNFSNGRGNATAYATYRDTEALKQSARDYSGCALANDSSSCGGSGTIPDGRIADFGTGPGFDYKVQGTDFVPTAGTLYNYGPENHFQMPNTRYTLGAFAHYDVSDQVTAYTELMFMDSETNAQIAPSGAFFVTNTIPCGNPLLSDQQFEALCGQYGLTEDDVQNAYLGRRNVEGGNRNQDIRHTTFRMVGGLKGQINDAWHYDAYALYSEVSQEGTYNNELSTTRIVRALDAVEDPVTGDTVCQSVVDGSDGNCVPWDIFTTGAVTDDMLQYLYIPLFDRGTTDQTVLSGYMGVDLGEYGAVIPTAETGVQLVFGAEYREENLDYNPDSGYTSGDGAGQGGAVNPVSGGYDVKELFLEMSMPIVQGKSFAEDITLDVAYRYSDYSYDIQTDTYGISGAWAINQDWKLRAGFQHAVRAANVRELFLAQGLALFSMSEDPCGGADPLRSLADCQLSGVTPAQYGNVPNSPAGQYNYLQGGNTELEPEEADTYTFGVVFTKDWVDGFSLSVDYYDIEIEKGISNLSPDFILDQCLDGNTAQCANVSRGNPGDLWIGSNVESSGQITALNDNLAIEQVKGWDIIADLNWEIGKWGSLHFNNNLAYIDTWDKSELEGVDAIDCKGGWGTICETPTPELQNNLRTTWTTPWNLQLSGSWRHIDGTDDLYGNGQDLDTVDYFDLAAIWDVTDWATLRAGVNNFTDEEPPIAGGAASSEIYGSGNVFPGAYDHLGRYWFLGFSVGF